MPGLKPGDTVTTADRSTFYVVTSQTATGEVGVVPVIFFPRQDLIRVASAGQLITAKLPGDDGNPDSHGPGTPWPE